MTPFATFRVSSILSSKQAGCFWYKWNCLSSLLVLLKSVPVVSTLTCANSEHDFDSFVELIESLLFSPVRGEIKVLCCEILNDLKITASARFIATVEDDLYSGNESYSLYDHYFSLMCLRAMLKFEMNISKVQTTSNGQIVESLKDLCCESTSIYSDVPYESLMLLESSFTSSMLLELVVAIDECNNLKRL